MVKEMVGGCCVCSDERGWDENPLVYCDGHGCNVAVHQACYGIVQVPKGPWFCRKCESQERIARVKCELCPMKEGALKRTDTGGWAHVLCALYIPEVRFGNVSTMEPIILSSVPHEKFQKTCYLCEEHGRESKTSAGACMQCNKIGCRQAFHVTCAQAAKLLCEEQQGVSANTVKYVGYCSYHWNKKGKGIVVPRPNDRARSKAEGRTQVQKPDISKRPSVIGTTKSTESPSPPTSAAKQKNRKLSKASDSFLEPLSATDCSNLPGSQHLMKTQKITSPLNTPSVRDHIPSYPNVVSTHFPFQPSVPKLDTGNGQAVSNGASNPVLSKSSETAAQPQSSKEIWKSPSAASTVKKSDKSEKIVNNTSSLSSGETKNSNSSGSSITKKRKNNKTSSADEDGKKKQKTIVSHDKKNSYSASALGKGKMPVLPPSPFISKSSSSSSIPEMEIPTKLDDFLEFQWKQGVEFLSHQPGYLDVASLLSCLHQLKHENVKLEARLSELVKRRDHLLLVNSRLSKPLNLSMVTSPPSLTRDVKRTESESLSFLENLKNSNSERNNQAVVDKSQENGSSEIDIYTKESKGSSQASKQEQDAKIQAPIKEQLPTKKEQRERPQSDVQLPQTVKETTHQTIEIKSPVSKEDAPANVEINERLREAASSPLRGNKPTAEGKVSAVSLSSVERPPSQPSPKSRKSPQGSGGKNTKTKSQEQVYQQEHQKMIQQQHQQLKQQQLNRQKFQQSHLLPLQQGNQQFNQHFAHQNAQLAFFKLPGYNSSEQHAMHQSKQGPVSINGSPQQYNSQSLPRQFPNFVSHIEPGSIHNVRMQDYMPVYPGYPLSKVMEEKIDHSAGIEKPERRN